MPKSMLQITHDTLKKYALFSKVEFEIKANWHIIEILHATPTSLTGFDCIATQYQQQYIIVENSQLTDTWRQLTTQLAPIGIDAWQYFAIEQLRVYTQQQTSLCFLPQMLDLHGAISFNKGCYLGQEIVARTEHRGKVKKRLQKVLLENEHAIGESAPSHPGSIIVSTAKTDGGHIALIVARVDDNSSQP